MAVKKNRQRFLEIIGSANQDQNFPTTLINRRSSDLQTHGYKVIDFDLKQIAVCAVQDYAAKSVARAGDIEVETCGMHDGEKFGASAIGRLVRKDGRGGVVNSFPKG